MKTLTVTLVALLSVTAVQAAQSDSEIIDLDPATVHMSDNTLTLDEGGVPEVPLALVKN